MYHDHESKHTFHAVLVVDYDIYEWTHTSALQSMFAFQRPAVLCEREQKPQVHGTSNKAGEPKSIIG